jgi:hypothetical protein
MPETADSGNHSTTEDLGRRLQELVGFMGIEASEVEGNINSPGLRRIKGPV